MDLKFPDIHGADRGFNVAADVLTQTADGEDLNGIYNEFVEALALQNANRNLISRLFTFDTTDSFLQFADEPGVGEEFEPESEFGVPKSSRRDIAWLRLGFPLEFFDAASRFTHKYLRDASAEQVRLQFMDKLEQDNRMLFRQTLSAVTTRPATIDARDTNENAVPIYSLWDGLGDATPPSFAGKTFSSNHSHYLVSGAATIDGGDLKALIDTIQEHGYGLRESNEQIVIMVRKGSANADAIRGFRRDSENPAINPYDFIPAVNAPAYLTDETIVGDRPPATYQGLPIIGSYGDAWLFESYFIPDGYAIALATSGAGSQRNPLAFRQHRNPGLHGLRLLNPNQGSRYPLIESYYQRGFGVGVANRSAAAVMQIKASGSYVSPTWP